MYAASFISSGTIAPPSWESCPLSKGSCNGFSKSVLQCSILYLCVRLMFPYLTLQRLFVSQCWIVHIYIRLCICSSYFRFVFRASFWKSWRTESKTALIPYWLTILPILYNISFKYDSLNDFLSSYCFCAASFVRYCFIRLLISSSGYPYVTSYARFLFVEFFLILIAVLDYCVLFLIIKLNSCN